MWYSKQLRQVRRARKSARAQQHKLLEMELEGIVAITLHSVTQSLTVATEREAGVQVIDLLGQALRERRQVLKTEAQDLLENWEESERLHVRKGRPLSEPSSAGQESAS